MWSFYGSKSKIVKKYPAPDRDLVIENFAGSARYALQYFDRKVILIDIDPIIIGLWNWLKSAQPQDILSLPDIGDKEKIPTNFSREERWLMGFCANNGSSIPKLTAGTGNFNSWNKDKKRIADNLYKIRHWDFILGEWDTLANVDATYFVDPPYQGQGKYYRHNKIDYKKLGDWCLSRRGQMIVCENSGADWLPFTPLTEMYGQLHKRKEVIFYQRNK